MNESFEIPVVYRGQQYCFPARFRLRGYQQQFQVDVLGVAVIFERDEEEQYRAVVEASQVEKPFKLDARLLESIAQVLQSAPDSEGVCLLESFPIFWPLDIRPSFLLAAYLPFWVQADAYKTGGFRRQSIVRQDSQILSSLPPGGPVYIELLLRGAFTL
jgi:hypothetical protein